jgi:hypothetical protein
LAEVPRSALVSSSASHDTYAVSGTRSPVSSRAGLRLDRPGQPGRGREDFTNAPEVLCTQSGRRFSGTHQLRCAPTISKEDTRKPGTVAWGWFH